jgi:hypothetical protein
MDPKKALEGLRKAQVIDLIIWQMFAKGITLVELTARIKEKEKEVIDAVNDFLAETLEEKEED